MRSSQLGVSTSDAEVTHINTHGVWLLVNGKEYFLPYEDYPWFREAKAGEILKVELHHGSHLHWPALDVDLSVDSLDDPDKFPLVYR